MQNEEINVKKILAVINATYAAAKRKPEKIRLAGIRTLTSAMPVQRSARIFFTFILFIYFFRFAIVPNVGLQNCGTLRLKGKLHILISAL